MRIIHTSDWHLGKELGSFSLLPDQSFFLDRLCQKAEEEKADVLLIAGDLYHRSIPPTEAVLLLDQTINRLVEKMEIPVLAIAGNHDSPERLSFGAKLYEKSGFHLAALPLAKIHRVTLHDRYGPVNFFLLPYLEPYKVRALLGDSSIHTYQDAYSALLSLPENVPDQGERNVILAHGYFSPLRSPDTLLFSDSERSIGGADVVDVSLFDAFDYAALGHLHTPQKAGRETARYSGSLLKYSISEARQKKSIISLDLKKKGDVLLHEITIPPLRDLRILKGALADILAANATDESLEDYVFAQLSDSALYDAMGKLRSLFPNAIGLTLGNEKKEEADEEASFFKKEHLSPLEQFIAFYENRVGHPPTAAHLALIQETIKEAEEQNR